MGRVQELTGGTKYSYSENVIEEWYRFHTGGSLDRKKYSYIVGRKQNNIGSVVVYSDYTGYSITMDVCAPRALTRGLIKEMWDYPFNQLKVSKVFGFIDTRNKLSQRTFSRMGCRHIATIKDFFGKDLDRLVYVAEKDDVAKWVTS